MLTQEQIYHNKNKCIGKHVLYLYMYCASRIQEMWMMMALFTADHVFVYIVYMCMYWNVENILKLWMNTLQMHSRGHGRGERRVYLKAAWSCKASIVCISCPWHILGIGTIIMTSSPRDIHYRIDRCCLLENLGSLGYLPVAEGLDFSCLFEIS